MKREGKCNKCSAPASLQCSACFLVFYCGVEHQKEDWKGKHKKICTKPFKVQENTVAGRFMVANRDLNEGDVILREKPTIVGPNLENSQPICIVCFRLLENLNKKKCGACGAPVCSQSCAKAEIHADECLVFRQDREIFFTRYEKGRYGKTAEPNMQLILPTRIILLKRKNDLKRYKAFMALQSHTESRSEHQKDRVRDRVYKLLEKLRLHSTSEGDFGDLIQRICGIFDTNSFDLASSHPGQQHVDLTGVYPQAAMLMHSCVKNTRIIWSADFTMTVYARTAIKAGDAIYHCYTNVFLPTNLRRLMLFTGKHFSCECARCADPTELGTFASGFVCTDCKVNNSRQRTDSANNGKNKGLILPENPLDLNTEWRCNLCEKIGFEMGAQAAQVERRISEELESMDKRDVTGLTAFIEKYSGTILYEGHAFIAAAKRLLCVVGYSRFGYLNPEQIEKKISLCKSVLEYVGILEPGLATRKGLFMYELATALKMKAETLAVSKVTTTTSTETIAGEWKCLMEAVENILKYESPDSEYGRLHTQVEAELKKGL